MVLLFIIIVLYYSLNDGIIVWGCLNDGIGFNYGLLLILWYYGVIEWLTVYILWMY